MSRINGVIGVVRPVVRSPILFKGVGGLPALPAGYVFLVLDDGSYVVTDDGSYIIVEA